MKNKNKIPCTEESKLKIIAKKLLCKLYFTEMTSMIQKNFYIALYPIPHLIVPIRINEKITFTNNVNISYFKQQTSS